MGVLVCSRCKATIKADSIDEGRKRLDHGVGLYIGKPCEDGKAELFFTGEQKKQISKTTKIDKKHVVSKKG